MCAANESRSLRKSLVPLKRKCFRHPSPTPPRPMVDNNQTSAAKGVFLQMLDNIHAGQWPVGATIPSERDLIEEFGVSRIAIREAMSMLRGLGVVDVSHGKRTRVRTVDLQVLDQLLPVMLACCGQKTFSQIFEVRLALTESRSAYLAAAAGRRTTSKRLTHWSIDFARSRLTTRKKHCQRIWSFIFKSRLLPEIRYSRRC